MRSRTKISLETTRSSRKMARDKTKMTVFKFHISSQKLKYAAREDPGRGWLRDVDHAQPKMKRITQLLHIIKHGYRYLFISPERIASIYFRNFLVVKYISWFVRHFKFFCFHKMCSPVCFVCLKHLYIVSYSDYITALYHPETQSNTVSFSLLFRLEVHFTHSHFVF